MKKVFWGVAFVFCITNLKTFPIFAYDTLDYDVGPLLGVSVASLGFVGEWELGHIYETATVQPESLIYEGADTAYQDISGLVQVTGNGRIGRFLDTDPNNGPFSEYINDEGTIGKSEQTIYISFLLQSAQTSPFFAFELKREYLTDSGAVLYIGNDISGQTKVQVCAFRNRSTDDSNIGYQLNWLGEGTTDTELYVIRIDFGSLADDVTVYRNPSLESEPDTLPTLVGAGSLDFDAISIGAWNTGSIVRIDEICIASTYSDVTRFYTRASMAQNPSPANCAEGVEGDPGITLSWDAGQGQTPSSYDVYFSDDLSQVLTREAEAYQGNTIGTNFLIPTIETEHTYYWSVNELMADSSEIPGQVWIFETTKALPSILSHPTDQWVYAGQTASFSVEASSLHSVTYQWYNNEGVLADGGNVSGAQTRTLYIADAQIADEGDYYCEVTNTAGTIVTNSSALVVKRLVGYWKLDRVSDPDSDPASVTFQDSSAVGNDLECYYTLPDKFVWEDGVDGTSDGALVFNGKFALGTMKEDGAMNDLPVGDAPYMISLWFKIAYKNANRGLVGWGNYGTDSQCNAVCLNVDRTGLRNYWWNADLSATRDYDLSDENWHQVVVGYDGDTRVIYIDGIFSASDEPASHDVQTSENFLIGKTNTNNEIGEFNDGVIDEVKIYNYFDLTDIEVAEMYTDIMGGDLCVLSPTYDVDGDCRVDINDLALLTSEWMECGLVPTCVTAD